jgi:hypothetical protein
VGDGDAPARAALLLCFLIVYFFWIFNKINNKNKFKYINTFFWIFVNDAKKMNNENMIWDLRSKIGV